ncbi:helix-turn-helix domain-containing protein [Acinetobacter sp. WCHAc060033]|uniref:LexA family protein n=1 Tax=Acinetobacter sp. WCHAc060033 TaxID=2518624 RepID=UPI0010234D8B|nr:helix-turn-helix domain-containing protein [Acinetobacter sp. WCHAc060033]RZG74150.1 helix-turn-helix domain-containing protein [Acinetobacter sp. WCHAc060033]
MFMHERIQQKLEEKNLKQADIARATGKSTAAVTKWLKGDNIPKAENLKAIAKLLNVSDEWLLNGKENKQPVSNTEYESNVSFISTPLREIPLLDYVQAGLFHDVGYDGINPIGSSWTTYMGAKPECIFSLKVEGLSMSPTFMPGDELVVDGSLEAKPGSLVIAQEVQHGIARTTFKKYRVIGVNEFGVDIIELVPLNPDFPTLNSLQIDISIIGVVVRHNREV